MGSLRNGLIWAGQMRDLVDPISGLVGTNDGTVYDVAQDARDYDAAGDEIGWANPAIVTDMSFSCWVNLRAVAGAPRLISMRGSGGQATPLFYLVSGRPSFVWHYSITALNIISVVDDAISAGEWVHLAATSTGSAAADTHLFVDAAETAFSTAVSGVGVPAVSDETWVLGNDQGGAAAPNGLIADPYAWNRVLSPAEVRSLFLSSRYRP